MKLLPAILATVSTSLLGAEEIFLPHVSKEAPAKVETDQFQVPAGLEVTVWATTPQLHNPTNFDIDHHGRMWICEGVRYRRNAGRSPEGDRIVVVQDTNGDGKADSSHVFVQEEALIAPLGIAVFDNKIFVSQPPSLIVYTDVDQNLRFDPAVDLREELLTGFNGRNHDHSLHSVTGGPDGKLIFNVGNCGAIFEDRDGREFVIGGPYFQSGGGDWVVPTGKRAGERSADGHRWSAGATFRMNEDGTGVEVIGHGYRNSYEQTANSFGDLFQNDNDDPPACRVSFILEYGSAGYFSRDGLRFYHNEKRPGQDHGRSHWRQDDPGTMDAGDIYGGGSPTGIVFYENGALGKEHEGTLLSCEPGRNTIFGYQPESQGATFRLERTNWLTTNVKEEFLGSDFTGGTKGKSQQEMEAHLLFRPSDVAVGPDGALYVTDWYDARVGGHAELDQSASGTIYRIAPKGFRPVIPKIDLTTIEGAILALKSPAVNTRYLGFHALKKQGPAALKAVSEMLSDEQAFFRVRAIWLLPHLGEEGFRQAEALLGHDDPRVRGTTIRALRRTKADLIPKLKVLAQDPDESVRREVALALRDQPAESTKEIFVELARRVDVWDKNALEAIGLGAAGQEEVIWEALHHALGHDDPLKWEERFVRLTWRLWPKLALESLAQRANSPILTEEERIFAVESIAFIDHAQAASVMLSLAQDNSLVRGEATRWLIQRGLGEWAKHGVMEQLKTAGIYDPTKIALVSVTVPEEPKERSFTVKEVLELSGDPPRGEEVANRCVICHEIKGIGPAYGPSLRGWGANQPAEVIARALVEPSADISHGFDGTKITLKDGQGAIEGMVTSPADPLIILSTGGLQQLIPKAKIEKQEKMGRSLMLSAEQLGLTAQDVADLVAFLKNYAG